MMNFVKRTFSKKKDEYEASTSENSSTTSNSYQNGKKPINKRQQAKNPAKNNIPSFITQVGRDGKPLQQFGQEENNNEEVQGNQNNGSFFERLCSCFKTKKQQISEEDEVSQSEQDTNQAPLPTPVQQQTNQEQQGQKQRGPLQTSAPKIIKQQDLKYYGKKSLVIDLDETLVHSSFTMIQNADFTLQITVQNMPFIVYVKKRPGCEFFLEELSKYYELIIYTASLSEYADPVMDKIDKNRVCSLRLFRENCTLYNGVFVKDMSLMNRDLKDIIIIDNSETSFLFQPANAVHIKSFFDDTKDRELYRLIPVLIFLSNSFDVRHVGNWWREFEQNDFIDYRDKKNRLQRLDKQKMLEELGDLRSRDSYLEAESMYDNNSQLMLNKGRESFQVSPKNGQSQSLVGNGIVRREESDKRNEKYKKNFQQKKPLMIEVPEAEETDNLPAARINPSISSNGQLESVRNKLLGSQNTPQYSEMTASTKNSGKSSAFKFNEYEDYNRRIKEEDPYNFKTQPDALEEESESYKEMKQIFDNIRYSYNNQNLNSPVSKQRFIALLDSNSYRKNTQKNSAVNDQEIHYFASPKKQQSKTLNKADSLQSDAYMSQLSYKPEIQDDDEELTNKDSDDIAIINKEEQEGSSDGTN